MKAKHIFVMLVIVALLLVPLIAEKVAEGTYSPLADALLNILLCIASIYIGISFNTEKARTEAASRWLPASEGACNNLLSISYGVERLRRKQRRWCEGMAPLLPKDDFRLETVLKMHCDELSDSLATLQSSVDNSFQEWKTFIRSNCRGNECIQIYASIEERREQLESALTRDHGNGNCCPQQPRGQTGD